MGQLDGGVNRGMCRNAIQLEELVGAETQQQQRVGFQLLQWLAGKPGEGEVETAAQAQDPVDQLGEQTFLTSVHGRVPLQIAVQQPVGVATLFDAPENFVGARAGVDVFY